MSTPLFVSRFPAMTMPAGEQPPAPSVYAPPAVRVHDLSRRFGDFTAVDNISLVVEKGSFFGFLGPNGAGKSTTIRMLTGLLAPSSGRIEIQGLDLQRDALDVKRQIGVVPEDLNLFERLTGAEYLTFAGRMYGLDRNLVRQRTAELLRLMELEDKPGTLLAEYSHGMRKKICLAAALIHNPQVLFLDEPFEGVDAVAAKTIKNLLERMRETGVTIFLTSHILEIVERLCTEIAIINRGRIVAAGSIRELQYQGEDNLEDFFVRLVGGEQQTRETLSWIG
ncbi:MAG: ABC transporter ATP-binding protein [Blastocatellia bacterium]